MQRLIFRKFLNIKIGAKMAKSEKVSSLCYEEADFDTLFEMYLKPLKSKNARKIFKVLSTEESVDSMTTLDIQTKLDDSGTSLSKKEINGWLHSLSTAGLALKDESRGKPTTIDYDDKYTFDHWRLTELGVIIAENLPHLLRTNPIIAYNDTKRILKELSEMEMDRRARILRNLDELNLVIKMLQHLLEKGCESNRSKLMKILGIPREEVDRLTSKYSNQDIGPTLMILKPHKPGLTTRVLCLLGLSHSRDEKYYLTEEGRQIAEAILS